MVLGYYKGSVIKAVLDLYPNIGLDRHLFKSVTGILFFIFLFF